MLYYLLTFDYAYHSTNALHVISLSQLKVLPIDIRALVLTKFVHLWLMEGASTSEGYLGRQDFQQQCTSFLT